MASNGGLWAAEGAGAGTARRDAVARAPAQRVRQSPRLAELEVGGATTAAMPTNTNTNHRARAAREQRNRAAHLIYWPGARHPGVA